MVKPVAIDASSMQSSIADLTFVRFTPHNKEYALSVFLLSAKLIQIIAKIDLGTSSL